MHIAQNAYSTLLPGRAKIICADRRHYSGVELGRGMKKIWGVIIICYILFNLYLVKYSQVNLKGMYFILILKLYNFFQVPR